ncbi:FIG022606: AAA ATPase [hydrothermal vent metagenome]|uniref:FIG022606: AAA ATPase n=1 Tax=hydrothermal vent metagenome TaxID=652676 RepID=A0A3B1D9C9_9ZZZZ
MYHKFYGFKEPPFNLTPNSRFFFSSTKHTEALSTMLYAIEHRKGFVVITGDVGSGKTTVCRTLLNQLGSNTQTALITNTHLDGHDLLMTILEDLEIEFTPGSKSKLHSQLNAYLIEQIRNNNNVVLIIDEAQNLTPSVLEEVRMLSNLETENEKLIQIIFLGQPELKQKLALKCLEQLRQRIAVYFHLTPLNFEDMENYILYRLKISLGEEKQLFTKSALKMIYTFSKGVPRLVNQICDSALLTGYLREKLEIGEEILQEVIEESPMTVIGQQESEK